MITEQERPKIGTAVWVRKDGKILLGIRNKAAGFGEWCPPGGHLEMFESLEECAIRETREEAGLEIVNVKSLHFSEDPWQEGGTHFITVHFVADWQAGEVSPKPDEFQNLEWFDWENLPSPLFRPAKHFAEARINPLEI